MTENEGAMHTIWDWVALRTTTNQPRNLKPIFSPGLKEGVVPTIWDWTTLRMTQEAGCFECSRSYEEPLSLATPYLPYLDVYRGQKAWFDGRRMLRLNSGGLDWVTINGRRGLTK